MSMGTIPDAEANEWMPQRLLVCFNGMWNMVFLPNPDQRADNDGLFQRYTQSCAPTTAQMTKAAADPIHARALPQERL